MCTILAAKSSVWASKLERITFSLLLERGKQGNKNLVQRLSITLLKRTWIKQVQMCEGNKL